MADYRPHGNRPVHANPGWANNTRPGYSSGQHRYTGSGNGRIPTGNFGYPMGGGNQQGVNRGYSNNNHRSGSAMRQNNSNQRQSYQRQSNSNQRQSYQRQSSGSWGGSRSGGFGGGGNHRVGGGGGGGGHRR